MRRDSNSTLSRVRCLVFPALRLPYCRRCCVARVYRVKKVCRSTTALTPYWSSSSRACCGIHRLRCRRGVICVQPGLDSSREGVWHHMEDRAVIPDSPVKFDRYVERAVFQFHPVRPSLVATPVVEDLVQTTLPYPYGRRYVHTLLPEWRSVVAALARAIHGGFQGFTLPLRFNGRPHRDRIPYMGSFFWTKIIEEVWEDMSQKMRELEG